MGTLPRSYLFLRWTIHHFCILTSLDLGKQIKAMTCQLRQKTFIRVTAVTKIAKHFLDCLERSGLYWKHLQQRIWTMTWILEIWKSKKQYWCMASFKVAMHFKCGWPLLYIPNSINIEGMTIDYSTLDMFIRCWYNQDLTYLRCILHIPT